MQHLLALQTAWVRSSLNPEFFYCLYYLHLFNISVTGKIMIFRSQPPTLYILRNELFNCCHVDKKGRKWHLFTVHAGIIYSAFQLLEQAIRTVYVALAAISFLLLYKPSVNLVVMERHWIHSVLHMWFMASGVRLPKASKLSPACFSVDTQVSSILFRITTTLKKTGIQLGKRLCRDSKKWHNDNTHGRERDDECQLLTAVSFSSPCMLPYATFWSK